MPTPEFGLVVAGDYEPGHIAIVYGNGATLLGNLSTIAAPSEGDFRAELCVNGEWRIDLIPKVGPTRYLREARDITPPIESALKGTSDGDIIHVDGIAYEARWWDNNWFEVYVDVFRKGGWHQANEGDIWEGDVGPTPETMRALLLDAIVEQKKQAEAA